MGLLQRNAWELTTVALYVLLGGDDEMDVVAGDHTRHVRIIIERNEFDDLRDVIVDWPTSDTKLNIENVARELGPLLQAAGDTDADPSVAYDMLYRAESTFGAHGFGAMNLYVNNHGDPWSVTTDPGPLTVPHAPSYLGLTALYTALLAHYVFKTFGIGTGPLDERSRGVHAVLEAKPDDDPAG